jgi:hypothetical protein
VNESYEGCVQTCNNDEKGRNARNNSALHIHTASIQDQHTKLQPLETSWVLLGADSS